MRYILTRSKSSCVWHAGWVPGTGACSLNFSSRGISEHHQNTQSPSREKTLVPAVAVQVLKQANVANSEQDTDVGTGQVDIQGLRGAKRSHQRCVGGCCGVLIQSLLTYTVVLLETVKSVIVLPVHSWQNFFCEGSDSKHFSSCESCGAQWSTLSPYLFNRRENQLPPSFYHCCQVPRMSLPILSSVSDPGETTLPFLPVSTSDQPWALLTSWLPLSASDVLTCCPAAKCAGLENSYLLITHLFISDVIQIKQVLSFLKWML
jgi:hypothetical protein